MSARNRSQAHPAGTLIDRALTIRQPWAWAILHAGKNIENRRWSTRFRGPFWIHAAASITRFDYEKIREVLEELAPRVVVPSRDELQLGGIVGRASLVDCLPPRPRRARGNPWHSFDQYGFVLDNVQPVDWVRCKGQLNFWHVPANVLRRLKTK